MTQTPYDSSRLDRIEAALDQLVGVAASSRHDIDLLSERIGSLAESVSELRQSTSELSKSSREQRESITELRESFREQADIFWETQLRLQADIIGLKIAFRDSIQQAEIDRAEMRRIWEYLTGEHPNGREDV